MPNIFTFTANMLAETTHKLDDWSTGATHRAKSESFQVGGKGINVCKMLNKLGAHNEAICFPGGDHGPQCLRWLEQRSIRAKAFAEGCQTRSGLVVNSQRSGETTFLGVDSFVTKEAIQQAVAYLKEQTNHHILAICGVIPYWEEIKWDALRSYLENRRNECHLVVDTYGPALSWLAAQRPELVKINRQELESLSASVVHDKATPELLNETNSGSKTRWIVTKGGDPIWLKDGNKEAHAIDPPEIPVVSATGSGDVFLATFMHAFFCQKGISFLDAATKAAEYASRNAAMPGIAEFQLD